MGFDSDEASVRGIRVLAQGEFPLDTSGGTDSSSNLQCNFVSYIASHYEMLEVKSAIKIKSNLAGVGGGVGNSR